jgi:rhodanese-related sulfurtransferase
MSGLDTTALVEKSCKDVSRPAAYSTTEQVVMFPEITVNDLNQKLKSDEKFILLDIREPVELEYARMADDRLEVLPMSRLAEEGVSALPESVKLQDVPVYIMCHHGTRSAQVTAWLAQQGYKNVFNVGGGIDAYARNIDSSVGFY